VLSGYQEVITDPSYAGQIITFTYPHIGNVGVNATDFESRRPFCRGVIVREMARRRSNHRADADLGSMLRTYGIAGIAGLDTRRLTRLLRDTGSMNGAFGAGTVEQLHAAALAEAGTAGVDLVSEVTTPTAYRAGDGARTIVAYDFGLKHSIVRDLAALGTVHVVPAGTTADEVLALRPHGVFLSNGPGDPEVALGPVSAIRQLLGEVPIFGICLGHQLLSLALGGTTFKLPFGHHGGNHPVRHERSGVVEITSQNHNFCVDPASVADVAEVTHLNLNDMTVEGLQVRGRPAFSVQYHPEAGPGPHDSKYLFAMFAAMMDNPSAHLERAPRSYSLANVEPAALIAPERGVA
jgi:carbamoyl-phosphate synthase small subunit